MRVATLLNAAAWRGAGARDSVPGSTVARRDRHAQPGTGRFRVGVIRTPEAWLARSCALRVDRGLTAMPPDSGPSEPREQGQPDVELWCSCASRRSASNTAPNTTVPMTIRSTATACGSAAAMAPTSRAAIRSAASAYGWNTSGP